MTKKNLKDFGFPINFHFVKLSMHKFDLIDALVSKAIESMKLFIFDSDK